MFGCLENERKGKEAGELKASSQIKLLLMEKILLQCLCGAFILPQPSKNTKEPKSKAITGDKMGRKPKRGTNVNKSNGQQEGTVNRVNSASR